MAIALSLVPPLTVVGLTIESRAWTDALGALLVFGTNVAAILTMGVVILRLYGIRPTEPVGRLEGSFSFLRAYGAVALLLSVVLILLVQASWSVARRSIVESRVSDAVSAWADDNGWELVGVRSQQGIVVARVVGAPPVPDPRGLDELLSQADVDPSRVELELLPRINVGARATTTS